MKYKVLKPEKLVDYGFECLPEIGGWEKQLIETYVDIRLALICNVYDDDTTTLLEDYTYSFSFYIYEDRGGDNYECVDETYKTINQLLVDKIIKEVE